MKRLFFLPAGEAKPNCGSGALLFGQRTKCSPVDFRCLLTLVCLSLLCWPLVGCNRSYADRAEAITRERATPPEQPVAYSHTVHIEAGLECKRCHAGAYENKRAGLPPLATCVSCHRRTVPDHPEVQKLMASWESETPILWTRVNSLPQKAMVQFHHGAHARAEVGCEECHGDVASMAAAEPVVEVANMGWCVACHRESAASDDCLTCHY